MALARFPIGEDQQRGADDKSGSMLRQGVVDIGSNSIRLVVFDGPPRSPVPIFNEKVMCGLGRRIQSTGRLDPDGVDLALDNLPRFVTAAAALMVHRLHVIATAAVREAADGADFVELVRRQCGVDVRVLSGDDEARLAGLGVLAGWPKANGIMGDLGGGSLEIVELDKGRVARNATLPLGPLRLMEMAARGDDPEAVVSECLKGLPWIVGRKARDFYAVGGAWRALARVHMAQSAYPLHVIDHYTVAPRAVRDYAGMIARFGPEALARMGDFPSRRLDTLPLAADVLNRLIGLIAPKRVTFSAQGLREGILFDSLDAGQSDRDPLLEAGAHLAGRFARFAGLGDALWRWSEPVFKQLHGNKRGASNLRRATCVLSDIGWMEHPDYRARHACQRILTLPAMGLDHPRRAFLAIAIFARYAGSPPGDLSALAAAVGLTEDDAKHARALGLVLSLGYTLSAGQETVLAATRLGLEDGRLGLTLPNNSSVYRGEAVHKRLGDVARVLAAEPAVRYLDEGGRLEAGG